MSVRVAYTLLLDEVSGAIGDISAYLIIRINLRRLQTFIDTHGNWLWPHIIVAVLEERSFLHNPYSPKPLSIHHV
jgi:hypothetical protein